MAYTARKDPQDGRKRAGGAILGVVSSLCKVCALPQSVQDDLARMRGCDGSSFESIAEEYNRMIQERIEDGTLQEGSEPITGTTLRNHFEKHATLTVDTLYPHVKDKQIDLLRDVLNKRAALFLQMHEMTQQVQSVANRKYQEWQRLLESEEALRRDYYETAVRIYEEAKSQYASDVEAARLRGEVTLPKPPPAAQNLPPIPTITGMAKEEERLMSLLEAVRKQVADAAKIISHEEGYIAYVNLEVEEMLKSLTQDAIDSMREFETTIRPMVPVDKHESVRDIIRGYLHRIHSNQKDRYKSLFRNLQKFTREMRSGGK